MQGSMSCTDFSDVDIQIYKFVYLLYKSLAEYEEHHEENLTCHVPKTACKFGDRLL